MTSVPYFRQTTLYLVWWSFLKVLHEKSIGILFTHYFFEIGSITLRLLCEWQQDANKAVNLSFKERRQRSFCCLSNQVLWMMKYERTQNISSSSVGTSLAKVFFSFSFSSPTCILRADVWRHHASGVRNSSFPVANAIIYLFMFANFSDSPQHFLWNVAHGLTTVARCPLPGSWLFLNVPWNMLAHINNKAKWFLTCHVTLSRGTQLDCEQAFGSVFYGVRTLWSNQPKSDTFAKITTEIIHICHVGFSS